jgi:hypothetical protein
MTHTLTFNGEIIKFTPNGEFVEIDQTTTQTVNVKEIETTNAWHGTWCYTGKVNQQVIKGNSWTSVSIIKARTIWSDFIKQGAVLAA